MLKLKGQVSPWIEKPFCSQLRLSTIAKLCYKADQSAYPIHSFLEHSTRQEPFRVIYSEAEYARSNTEKLVILTIAAYKGMLSFAE